MAEQFTTPISLGDLEQATFPEGNFIIGSKLLPANGLMVIGGPPKSYKSFVSSTLLYHLATGTNVFDTIRTLHGEQRTLEHAFPVPRPMRVLYLEQEIGFEDTRERLIGVLSHITPEQAALYRSNMWVYSRDMSMRLDREDGCLKIESLIEAVKPDVVCIDPLIEFHQQNENDASEMNLVFKNLDILREKHNFAAIICHHTSKPSMHSAKSGADLLRGTSALFGKGDSFLMLNVTNRNAGLIAVDFTIRRGKPISPLTLKLDTDRMQVRFLTWKSVADESRTVSEKGHKPRPN